VFTKALLRNSRYASLVGSLPGNASSYTLQYEKDFQKVISTSVFRQVRDIGMNV
jgi:hypothetical protein